MSRLQNPGSNERGNEKSRPLIPTLVVILLRIQIPSSPSYTFYAKVHLTTQAKQADRDLREFDNATPDLFRDHSKETSLVGGVKRFPRRLLGLNMFILLLVVGPFKTQEMSFAVEVGVATYTHKVEVIFCILRSKSWRWSPPSDCSIYTTDSSWSCHFRPRPDC